VIFPASVISSVIAPERPNKSANGRNWPKMPFLAKAQTMKELAAVREEQETDENLL